MDVAKRYPETKYKESQEKMLVKVECEGFQKYIKVPDIEKIFDLPLFLQEVSNRFSLQQQHKSGGELSLTDETGTEVDADIFDELLRSGMKSFKADFKYYITNLSVAEPTKPTAAASPISRLSLPGNLSPSSSNDSETAVILSQKRKRPLPELDRSEASQKVECVLRSHPKGEDIFLEYDRTKYMSDATRRLMVNILTAEMTQTYGRIPPKIIKTSYALGITALFPYLEDPLSQNGYEHFYDPDSNTGYLAWRLKTMQRKFSDGGRTRCKDQLQSSPATQRQSLMTPEQLVGEECMEALSVITNSTDVSLIKEKIRATFEYRQKLIHDDKETSSVFDIFPRFLDTPGLIEQDFSLMFGETVSEKFISKWPTYFKPKVIAECKRIPPNLYVSELLTGFHSENDNEHGWDSDVSSLLLLLHLLPPTARGPKKGRIRAEQAADYLIKFVKEGRSVPTFLDNVELRQPFLLCIGKSKKKIQRFFIIMDRKVLPCDAQSTLAAFDTLFKAHYVFSVPYNEALAGFYTFIQTAVYNIDVCRTKETPRVKELRARMLQGD